MNAGHWIAYALGVITLPLGWFLLHKTIQAFSRDVGYGPCEHCNHLGGKNGHDIGEVIHLVYTIESFLHRHIWARTKRHRIARGNTWRDKASRGYQNTRWSPKYML